MKTLFSSLMLRLLTGPAYARWSGTLAATFPAKVMDKPSADGFDYTALFHKLDLDNDNKLSLQEFIKLDPMTVQTPALKNADLNAVFHKLDADNDSQLTLDEFLKISSLAAGTTTPGVAPPPPQ